jgi:hypothetical protein
MMNEQTDNWYLYNDASSLGQTGSELGTIIADIEHAEGARITVETNTEVAPYAVTSGVYGILFHTTNRTTEVEAHVFLAETKVRIEELFKHLAIPIEQQNETWNITYENLINAICG